MKFRLISKNADGVALALKLLKEGHTVDFWVKSPKAKSIYRGIMAQAESWNVGLTPETVVFFDTVGMGGFATKLKNDGMYVYGGGGINDALETNLEFAINAAKTCKIKLPAYGKFMNFDDAIEFVKRSGKAWVFRAAENTYVSEDAEDMIGMLNYYKVKHGNSYHFILQERIRGVEVSIGGFYLNGHIVQGSLNSTLESIKLFEEDKGPCVDCMGSVVWFWQKERPKLYKMTLQKVESFLQSFKYSGPLSVICIVNEEDKLPYFLKYRTRFGCCATHALIEGIDMDFGNFLAALSNGTPPVFKRYFGWLGSVRVSIPPYPYLEDVSKSANKPIRGIDEHTWLLDAKANHDCILTAGLNGLVCEITGKGKNLKLLEKTIYSRIDRLKVPDKQYRSDIVTSAQKRLALLKKWKYFS